LDTQNDEDELHVVSRAEKKARTRSALMESVLAIIGYGANFASISLREVAKTAGLVPTSFYRHFGDMEELGLAMVDELGLNLRRLMRGTVDAEKNLDELITNAVTAYHNYVIDNANLFRFMNQARTGGTPGLQDAIRNEINAVIGRVATELSQILPSLKSAERETVAALIVSTLLENTTSLLAIPKGQESLRDELTERTMQQMALIIRGAQSRPKRARRAKAV
jgi:AcrR family transcriptional regulator